MALKGNYCYYLCVRIILRNIYQLIFQMYGFVYLVALYLPPKYTWACIAPGVGLG